jgi:hypothetical protein
MAGSGKHELQSSTVTGVRDPGFATNLGRHGVQKYCSNNFSRAHAGQEFVCWAAVGAGETCLEVLPTTDSSVGVPLNYRFFRP